MKTSTTHDVQQEKVLEPSNSLAPDDFPALSDEVRDIANDADSKVSAGDVEAIEELTAAQTARILSIHVDKVQSLINDGTLCCSRINADGQPLLDASCVRAQAGVTKDAFLSKVRRLIATEKSMAQLDDVPQGMLSALIHEAETLKSDQATDVAEIAKTLAAPSIHSDEHTGESIMVHNVGLLVDNLASATVRLEALMYRAGYLEARVEDLQEQLKIIPDLRTKAAQGLIVERENRQLKATISERETELLDVHQLLSKLRQNWFCRSWCFIFGVRL